MLKNALALVGLWVVIAKTQALIERVRDEAASD
jgi:hypothetical protein